MPTLAPPAIDLDAMRAAITATIATEAGPPAAEPAPEPDPADEHPALTANPTLTYALDAAFNELWPGESKSATAHRKAVWKAVARQLAEVEAYGLDLGGRVPIGDPIVLGNAVIEVDGYGDAVSITTTDGGMPLWDKP